MFFGSAYRIGFCSNGPALKVLGNWVFPLEINYKLTLIGRLQASDINSFNPVPRSGYCQGMPSNGTSKVSILEKHLNSFLSSNIKSNPD